MAAVAKERNTFERYCERRWKKCGRPRFNSWVGKIPWRREWQYTPVCLPGKSHGQRLQSMGLQWVELNRVMNTFTKGTSYTISPSFSELLHSLWESLGISMLLKMAYFIIFNGWAILHCVYVPHLYPFLYQWMFRLLLCIGYGKQCCNEHSSALIFLDHIFLWIYTPWIGW